VPVLTASALRYEGIDAVWDAVRRFHSTLSSSGELATKRARQAVSWLWTLIGEALQDGFRSHPAVAAALEGVTASVVAGEITPTAACQQLMKLYRPAR
jgi:LAO/AO transport system kinase